MKLAELFRKYCFHDSSICSIVMNPESREMTWIVDFCFWMQEDYVKGTPENGKIKLTFHNAIHYEGVEGDPIWYEIDNLQAIDGKVQCFAEGGILQENDWVDYEWQSITFEAESVDFENLCIDTTAAAGYSDN